jgi:hypothetical protein
MLHARLAQPGNPTRKAHKQLGFWCFRFVQRLMVARSPLYFSFLQLNTFARTALTRWRGVSSGGVGGVAVEVVVGRGG